ARTLSPNSTTATKLFPLVPYHRFVLAYGRAPNEASDPQTDEVNGTATLGRASSKWGAIASSSRWNRLISPHGVRHVPKSAVRRAVAAASDASSSASVVRSAA